MGIKQDLVEARGTLKQRQGKLHEIFKQAGDDLDMSKVTCLGEMDNQQKVSEIRKLSAETDELGKKVDELAALVKAQETASEAKNTPVDIEQSEEQKTKSLGDLFVESDAYKAFQKNHERNKLSMLDISVKTLFETGAGWDPETTRTGRLVEYATRPIQIRDLIPMGQTSQAAVVYMEETTFTNAADATDEGDSYPEATLETTEQSAPVRKIAVFLPVTDEQLEDVSQVRSYIQNRLRFMIGQAIDDQILNGDGSAPELTGILEKAGIQSVAKGSDPVPDAIYKAMVKVMTVGFTTPNAVIINPLDWQGVRLMRTSDGVYIWGNPSESGPERIWGTQVVKAHVISQGTALTGDFANFVEWTERRGIEVRISDSHDDYFVKGKQAIRADVRAAMPIYRPEAFCEVTDL